MLERGTATCESRIVCVSFYFIIYILQFVTIRRRDMMGCNWSMDLEAQMKSCPNGYPYPY